MTRPPDILLIILDTLRRDRLSAYGHTRPTSPELDAFAAGAARFERAVAPAQWTVPAHASLFTGLYPSRHGVTEAHHRLSGMHPTLAEILRGAGYHTVGFSSNPLVGPLDNDLTRGFERFFNYAGAVPNRPFERGSRIARLLADSFRRRVARPVQNRFARSEALFRWSMNPLLVPLWSRLIHFKGHTAHAVDDLIAYWDAHHAGGGSPLFAFVNLMGAHLPYHPPPAALDQVAPGLRRDRRALRFIQRFNADAGRWAMPPDGTLLDWQRQALLDAYDAEIAHQDAHLGRLLRRLRASGALIIIAADHGEGHGDHEFFGHGFVVYQELVHVPLILYDPDRLGGRSVPHAVSTRRVFHTVLDAAGVKPPLDAADPNADVAGLSLRRALADDAGADGGLAFAEAFPPRTFVSFVRRRAPALVKRLRLDEPRRAVYRGGYKLVVSGDRVEGLYAVQHDPAETTDLAALQPALAAELLALLAAFAGGREPFSPNGGDALGLADAAILDHLRALGYIE